MIQNSDLGVANVARFWAALPRLPVIVFHYSNIPAGKEEDIYLTVALTNNVQDKTC